VPPRPPARDTATRLADTRRRLATDIDAWVATAGPDGAAPHLVPLSFVWIDDVLLLSTSGGSVTGRNLSATGRARVAVGPTRDVVLVEGTVEAVALGDLPPAEADAFAEATGFDPRAESDDFRYFRVRPERVQAWREANELAGRDLMRDGRWVER
jgi:hypothetical protein